MTTITQTEAERLQEVAAELAGQAQVDGQGYTYPYADNPRLANFLRFFHRDGTWSDIAAPTVNPDRPKTLHNREQFVMHYLKKRDKDGQPIFYTTPQAPPPEMPFRCFVSPGGRQCEKRLRTLPDLYMHVVTRHAEEAKMYGGFLKEIEEEMQRGVDPDLRKAMGLPPKAPMVEPISPGDQVASPTKTETQVFACSICGKTFAKKRGRDMHESGPFSPHKKEKK